MALLAADADVEIGIWILPPEMRELIFKKIDYPSATIMEEYCAEAHKTFERFPPEFDVPRLDIRDNKMWSIQIDERQKFGWTCEIQNETVPCRIIAGLVFLPKHSETKVVTAALKRNAILARKLYTENETFEELPAIIETLKIKEIATASCIILPSEVADMESFRKLEKVTIGNHNWSELDVCKLKSAHVHISCCQTLTFRLINRQLHEWQKNERKIVAIKLSKISPDPRENMELVVEGLEAILVYRKEFHQELLGRVSPRQLEGFNSPIIYRAERQDGDHLHVIIKGSSVEITSEYEKTNILNYVTDAYTQYILVNKLPKRDIISRKRKLPLW